jgi:dephospho-CoA kinase
VLFVSVAARRAARSVVIGRLVELGAVRGRIDAPPPWEVSQQAIVLLDGADGLDGGYWPGLQVVIGASRPAGELERWPQVPDARLDLGGPADEAVAGIDALWADRLVPFEANLREGRRAARRQQAVLTGPDPTWAGQAACLIDRLRHSAGSQVMRIDHIGSTSVPGLPAKQLIDIQVVVSDLVVAARVAAAARRAGFVHVAGQWFGTDRWGADHPEEVTADADPGRPVNINIRPITAPIWRETLLFRDWLRSHDEERDAYAAMKDGLTRRPDPDVNLYSKDKMPWISAALARAESWAQSAAWSPAP